MASPSDGRRPDERNWRAKLRDNGLSLALITLFLVCWVGQITTGFAAHNTELSEHHVRTLSLVEYLQSGHFLEATFENWESEFFQMGLFVLLTVFLFQRGSSESNPPDDAGEGDPDPAQRLDNPQAPWPVRRGGIWLKLYQHSLSSALVLLFLTALFLHAVFGLRNVNEERALEGKPAEAFLGYVCSARFWFESFQNWQSEFLAVLAIVVLSIFLREKGSSQSKPVAAPHDETG